MLWKVIPQIFSKFTGKHWCGSVISKKVALQNTLFEKLLCRTASDVSIKKLFIFYILPDAALLNCLKLVSAIFYQIFSENDSLLKTVKKCFLFHLKSSFRSRDIQIFVIFYLPFHTLQIQKDKWKWNNLDVMKLTCINLQM